MTRARILRFAPRPDPSRAFEDQCIGQLAASDRHEWEELRKLDRQLASFHQQLAEAREVFVETLLGRDRAESPRTADPASAATTPRENGRSRGRGGKARGPEGGE